MASDDSAVVSGATSEGGAPKRQRPSAKFVVAVWGEHYIRRFERYALASILAPGNLPRLAREVDVEFVILTCESDIPYFESRELMRRAAQHAPARYIAIDDLIVPGAYAVTLTLAFTRGIVAFGPEQTRHHFIFWNADFVMSDGTLGALARHIVADRKVILAGSYRSVAEELEPRLDLIVRRDKGILSIPSRALVNLALRHPHVTSVARTVNQPHVRTLAPTQLFWSDFADTVVAHFFQIFMLSLKPTQAIRQINSYCDYGFIPELCPNEPLHIVEDSDEMFLLELQYRDQEQELVGLEANSTDRLLPSYAEWSTPEQRQAGRVPVVLHAGPLGEQVAALKQQSAAFVAELERRAPEPASHVGHRYWVWGVTSWLMKRRLEGRDEMPPELNLTLDLDDLKNASNAEDFRQRARALVPRAGALRRAVHRLLGRPPRLSQGHPQHASYAVLTPEIDRLKRSLAADPEFRLLIVGDLGGWIDPEFGVDDPRIFRVEPRHLRFWSLAASARVHAALLLIEYPEDPSFVDLLHSVGSAVMPGGEVVLAQRKPVHINDPAWMARGRLGALAFAQSMALGAAPETDQSAGGDSAFAEAAEELLAALRGRRVWATLRSAAGFGKHAWRTWTGRKGVPAGTPHPSSQVMRLRLSSGADEHPGEQLAAEQRSGRRPDLTT